MKVGVKTKGLQDVVTFGRWKGHTLQTVLDEDPDYIIWMNEHVDFFKVSEDVIQKAYEEINNAPPPYINYWTPWRDDDEDPWWNDRFGEEPH
jgi:hypothetical protein